LTRSSLARDAEQISEADSAEAAAELGLQLGQAAFRRTNGPAVLFLENFEGIVGSLVQGADVAILGSPPLDIRLHPSQRQSLGPTDVGPGLVDAACAVKVQKGTTALRVWIADEQQVSMVVPDSRGFDLEDGQVVSAALVAAAATLEPGRMASLQGRGTAIHRPVKPLEFGECPFGACRIESHLPPHGPQERFRGRIEPEGLTSMLGPGNLGNMILPRRDFGGRATKEKRGAR